MPIVVRELVIRARLDERSNGSSTPQPLANLQAAETINTDEIVSLCVEKVMEVIERKKER
ncbi:MAG: DUF5908 family protein [Bacteroidota bacterium]